MTFDPKSLAAGATATKSGSKKTPKATSNGQQENTAVSDPPADAPNDDGENPPAGESPDAENSAGDNSEQPAANRSVMIELPIGSVEAGFATPRIDVKLTPRQAAAAKMLWCSLSREGERFAGGRSSHPEGTPVDNINDGVRWLLDRVADAIENETKTVLVKDYELIFR